MRSTWDCVRSVRKYVAVGLGDAWEVRLAYEEGAYRRPYARVEASGAAQFAGPAHTMEVTQAVSVVCHPAEASSVPASIEIAEACRDALVTLIRVGVSFADSDDDATPVRGAPGRIPLWDYDDVDLDETSTKRGGSDYLRVTGFSVEVLSDPEDPLLRAVVADIRCAWRRAGPLREGPLLDSIHTRIVP